VGSTFGSGAGAGGGAVVHPMKNKRIITICDKTEILILANNDFILQVLSTQGRKNP
jgi:hypothetical protein